VRVKRLNNSLVIFNNASTAGFDNTRNMTLQICSRF
jgi:hypothetical protein